MSHIGSKLFTALFATLALSMAACVAEPSRGDVATDEADSSSASGAQQSGEGTGTSTLDLVSSSEGHVESTNGRETFGRGKPEPWAPVPSPTPSPQPEK